MPVAEQPQHVTALALANERRLARARERRELRGAPPKVITEAITHPTPALASYTLQRLLAPEKGPGIVKRFRDTALNAALAELAAQNPHGRRNWHRDLRLRELTEGEREQLAAAVVIRGPKPWREAA